MSLKLSVGIVNKSNMRELHTSFLSQRKMIAEINQAYCSGADPARRYRGLCGQGADEGTGKSRADVILAGTDRIAIDAVGVAILKELGSNRAIMEKPIFAQEQIARAVELGLGARNAGDIEIVSDDEAGRNYAAKIQAILAQG